MKLPHAKPQSRKEKEFSQELALFADLDRHFARFIAGFGGGEQVARAAAFLSRAVRQGHICLDLAVAPLSESGEPVPWLTRAEWREALQPCRAVGTPEASNITPLVLDAAGRLYLRRYYEYEKALARALRDRTKPCGGAIHEGQEAAIEAALLNPLTVISGGPGTGKTTTVVAILLRLLAQNAASLRIALAAPTGKAAARLEQSLREQAAGLAAIPHASTLHRLLGSQRNSAQFKHHAGNPLALDLLVVDEASMVPLPLMAKLFDALPPHARVILLGDRDQLASVEPGSVLADIVDAALLPGSMLQGMLAVLKKNYRFGNASAIYQLCETVREGCESDAIELLGMPGLGDLGSAPLPSPQQLSEALREPVLAGYGAYLRESDPARALEAFGQFRVLCAVRKGPYGVEELNRRITALLREAGHLSGPHALCAGMPLLITRNDPQLGVFNGDIALLLPDPAHAGTPEPPLWAWLPGDGESLALRRIAPAQLPEHEPAFAMTVHKSQGSEFDRALLVLPERESPVLTRELIYTGLTRARRHMEIWFTPGVLERSIARRTERASGLRDALAAK
ncbi:MAG: exodeoxyribonuclease V subunit alpha [Verrucomicrobiota bacterium]